MLKGPPAKKTKGAALFVVLGTLIVIVILAKVMLTVLLTQTRLGRHQVGRIQAYYAAQAGMNYAIEQLRTGAWKFGINCTVGEPCYVSDSEFPSSIGEFSGTAGNKEFRVIFCPRNETCGFSTICNPPDDRYGYCVKISVNYSSPEIST